jgi:hypothetical protein
LDIHMHTCEWEGVCLQSSPVTCLGTCTGRPTRRVEGATSKQGIVLLFLQHLQSPVHAHKCHVHYSGPNLGRHTEDIL